MVELKLGKRRFLIGVLLLGGIFLAGCNGEIARASIQQVGQHQLGFDHDGSPKDLWSDLDIEYIESTEIWYEIEIRKEGELLKEVICDPFDHEYRLMERHTDVRGVTKESFLAPMKCELGALPEGEIHLEIDLFAEGGRVRIFRADLVVKEGD